MRKIRKKQAEEFIQLLRQVHREIEKAAMEKEILLAMNLLEQCQKGAIELGNMIELDEGEGFVTIPFLEKYCEQIYQIYETLQQEQEMDIKKAVNTLSDSLDLIENSVKQDIPVNLEIVFLPYKASMWDSLESIWKAAAADPNCKPYVIPIPYYDRNTDKTLGTLHYEGKDFPEYVPVTPIEEYNFKERRPDIIYIHNPYDNINYTTSVDPRFYSSELKKYTDFLVYIPYYSTAGGMSEVQSLCLSYFYVDYIVVQSEKFPQFFDPKVPREKFLILGSPKFDRVIHLCNNPPKPPKEWEEQLTGRKVYFFNTSLGGMLGDTKEFLQKIAYVFACFKDRNDSCLLWRPHPLFESALASSRKNYYPAYLELKQYFIQHHLGIYDDTPDITKTIALCDAYIGDAGTSVTSLFGIVGKPLFILNNNIHHAPETDDWRGQFIGGLDKWIITQGNKLYYSPNQDYRYQYSCDLSGYSSGGYYCLPVEIEGKVYVCPANAQDILVINNHKIEQRILLKRFLEKPEAFAGACNIGKYLWLIPNKYPAIVRYDYIESKTDYIQGYQNVFAKYVDGVWKRGGVCVWENNLLFASPEDDTILIVNSDTMEAKISSTGAKNLEGCAFMVVNDNEVWQFPLSGTTIARWNPKTGAVREYTDFPKEFQCKSRPHGYACMQNPFSAAAFYKNHIYLSPCWGNMFLILDQDTGKAEEWIPPFEVLNERKNGYYNSWTAGYFLNQTDDLGEGKFRFFSVPDSKLYQVNLETREYQEVNIEFNLEELRAHEPGFSENSEWLQYSCEENYFNTLEGFLDGNIIGNSFDKEKQICAYKKIAVNNDGTSGEKIHQCICAKATIS